MWDVLVFLRELKYKLFKVNQCFTLFQNTALRSQCRQEKDLEKFKANYDVRERVAMETRWSNM